MYVDPPGQKLSLSNTYITGWFKNYFENKIVLM